MKNSISYWKIFVFGILLCYLQVLNGQITQFPFFESFEDSSPTRSSWTNEQVLGLNSNWDYQNGSPGSGITNAHSGNRNARFIGNVNNSNLQNITKLVSPIMDISSLENPQLSYWYAQQVYRFWFIINWFEVQNHLKIYYRTDPSSEWTLLMSHTSNVQSWTNNTLDLPNPSSTYQIAFEGITNTYDGIFDNYTGYPNVLDDVIVQDKPLPHENACYYVPSNLFENYVQFNGRQLAVDMEVADLSTSSINQFNLNTFGEPTYFNVRIYLGDGNNPSATPIHSFNNVPFTKTLIGANLGYNIFKNQLDLSSYSLILDNSTNIAPQKYWIQIESDARGWERSSQIIVGRPMAVKQGGNAWSLGDFEGVYEIIGDCQEVDDYCEVNIINTVYPITLVKFAEINNTSSSSTNSPAHEYFNHLIGSVIIGQTYTLTVKATAQNTNTNNRQYVSVWFDWNANGEFEPSERRNVDFFASNSPERSISVQIPQEAVLGTTKMRLISSRAGSNSNYPLDPCGTYSHGQAEDYSLFIRAEYTYQQNNWLPPNGNPNLATSSIAERTVFLVNTNPKFTHDIDIKKLVVNPHAKLTVEKNLKVNEEIINNGEITFRSIGIDQTAQFDEFYGTLSGTGNIVVQRFIPAQRAFRYLSSPITSNGTIRDNWQVGVNNTTVNPSQNLNPKPGFGTHITGSKTGEFGFDATPSGNPSLFLFNNSTQEWTAIDNTDQNKIIAGQPYRLMVRGDRSINVTSNSATPKNTILEVKGFNQNFVVGPLLVPFSITHPTDRWVLIGNPYQASVDVNELIASSVNINGNTYLVYDPSLGARGAFVDVDLIDGGNSNAESEANQFIQPGQAVFLLANDISGTVHFMEHQKNVQSDLTAVFKNSTVPEIQISLFELEEFEAGKRSRDGFKIKFKEDGNKLIDQYDVKKSGNLDENICVFLDGEYLSIETRDFPSSDDVINLYIGNYRYDNYVLKINHTPIENTTAFLVDRFTETITELKKDDFTYYNFSLTEDALSRNSDRFYIVFKVEEENMNTIDHAFSSLSIFPNPIKNNMVNISSPNHKNEILTLYIYGNDGVKIKEDIIKLSGAGNYKYILPQSIQKGIFTLLFIDSNKNVVSKKIIKQ